MEKLPGKNLTDAWPEMDLEVKGRAIDALADYLDELYSCKAARFPAIGNIYEKQTSDHNNESSFTVDRIVSMNFYWGQRQHQIVDRGPFLTSVDWFNARLQLLDQESDEFLASNSADEHCKKTAENTKDFVKRLRKLIPYLCPQDDIFVLHHDDLNPDNILVDPKTGQLTGIVDWECVSVLPAWRSCQLPWLLNQQQDRLEKPEEDNYEREQDNLLHDIYANHMEQWETTVN